MMLRKVLLMTGMCLLLAAEITAAETIGFVNLREILFSSTAGKKANEEIEKLRDKLQLQVKGSEADLQRFKEELEKQSKTVLDEAGIKSKQAEWQTNVNKHQMLVRGAEEELRAKQAALVNPIEQELLKIINAIAEKENYAAIFDTGAGVIYKKKGLDLTKRVLEEFEKAPKTKK